VSTEPRESCFEAVPGVNMSPRARYTIPRWFSVGITGPLTDKKIERYLRAGRYGGAKLQFPQAHSGRLVWSV
jgi:hypothetical protein